MVEAGRGRMPTTWVIIEANSTGDVASYLPAAELLKG